MEIGLGWIAAVHALIHLSKSKMEKGVGYFGPMTPLELRTKIWWFRSEDRKQAENAAREQADPETERQRTTKSTGTKANRQS